MYVVSRYVKCKQAYNAYTVSLLNISKRSEISTKRFAWGGNIFPLTQVPTHPFKKKAHTESQALKGTKKEILKNQAPGHEL